MKTYYYMLIIVLFLTLLFKGLKLNKSIYLFISSTIVGLIEGLRGLQVGTDTLFYYLTMHYSRVLPLKTILNSFPKMHVNDHYELVETGYILYNKFLSYIFKSDRVIFIVTSLLICWGMAWFINRQCDSVYIGMLFFICGGLYFYSFNVMRQFLAMTICLNSYTLLKKKHFILFTLLFLIAYSIHQSSLVFLLMIFMLYVIKKVKHDQLKLFILITPLFVPLSLRLLAQIIPAYAGYTTTHLFTVNINGIIFLWFFMFLMMSYYLFKFYGKYSDEFLFVIISGLLYIVLQIMSIELTGMYRVSFWFYCFQLMFFANFPKYLNKISQRYIYNLMLFLLMVSMFMSFAGSPTLQYSFFS